MRAHNCVSVVPSKLSDHGRVSDPQATSSQMLATRVGRRRAWSSTPSAPPTTTPWCTTASTPATYGRPAPSWRSGREAGWRPASWVASVWAAEPVSVFLFPGIQTSLLQVDNSRIWACSQVRAMERVSAGWTPQRRRWPCGPPWSKIPTAGSTRPSQSEPTSHAGDTFWIHTHISRLGWKVTLRTHNLSLSQ